jgi:hypothetical protein
MHEPGFVTVIITAGKMKKTHDIGCLMKRKNKLQCQPLYVITENVPNHKVNVIKLTKITQDPKSYQ